MSASPTGVQCTAPRASKPEQGGVTPSLFLDTGEPKMATNIAVTNVAGMLSAITTTIAYSNSSAVEIGTLPANCQIVDINIDVKEACEVSDAGGE